MPDEAEISELLDSYGVDEDDDSPLPAKDQADGATMLLYNLLYRRSLTRADFVAHGAIDARMGGSK